MKCDWDPTFYAGAPIGMMHCPKCGEMVLAGEPHPDYSLLDNLRDTQIEPNHTARQIALAQAAFVVTLAVITLYLILKGRE